MAVRERIYISGVVQGVGFRPHVFRLANQHSLTGWIQNTVRGITLEVQGTRENLDEFLRQSEVEAATPREDYRDRHRRNSLFVGRKVSDC